MKKILFICLLIPLLYSFQISEQKKLSGEIKPKSFIPKSLQVGEELTYLVKYSFMKLGEVKLKVLSKESLRGETVYNTIAYIDSYEDLPFAQIHQIYESKLNRNFYSDYFRGIVKGDKYESFTEYFFEYDSAKIKIIKGKVLPHQIWTDSTAEIHTQYQDGLSLFYYARMNSGKDTSVTLPTFIKEQKEKTIINFYNEVADVSIDAVDYDIACYKLDGEAKFVSIFGLTGFFEGWFSADDASIPIIAKMNVIIGNITLELISWKREGWSPPKFKD